MLCRSVVLCVYDGFIAMMVLLVCLRVLVFFVFFKQKTAYEMRISDWSSDVCSSDLYKAWWLLPLCGFVVGYATNAIALKVIFEPVEPVNICGFKEIGRASCRERVCQYV